jgi:hypothetical protein
MSPIRMAADFSFGGLIGQTKPEMTVFSLESDKLRGSRQLKSQEIPTGPTC